MSILLKINADQQTAAVAGELNQAGEELAGRFRFEVANGRSRKINHASRGKATRQRQLEWWTERLCHVRSVQTQSLDLGSGDVVLRQIADLLKQLSAALVVEKLTRQLSGRF